MKALTVLLAVLVSGCYANQAQEAQNFYEPLFNQAAAQCQAGDQDGCDRMISVRQAYMSEIQNLQMLDQMERQRRASVGLGIMAISQPQYQPSTTCIPMPGGGFNCF